MWPASSLVNTIFPLYKFDAPEVHVCVKESAEDANAKYQQLKSALDQRWELDNFGGLLPFSCNFIRNLFNLILFQKRVKILYRIISSKIFNIAFLWLEVVNKAYFVMQTWSWVSLMKVMKMCREEFIRGLFPIFFSTKKMLKEISSRMWKIYRNLWTSPIT